MVGRGNGKFLNHAGMIRAEVIQTTIEIGWYRCGDCTTGSDIGPPLTKLELVSP